MSYVIVNAENYRLLSQGGTPFNTAGGAKRSLTSLIKKMAARKAEYTERYGADGFDNNTGNQLEFLKGCVVMSLAEFEANEPMVERINLMSGEPYMERLNTPPYLSPASETYWSM